MFGPLKGKQPLVELHLRTSFHSLRIYMPYAGHDELFLLETTSERQCAFNDRARNWEEMRKEDSLANTIHNETILIKN